MKTRFTTEEINKILKKKCSLDKSLTIEDIQELFETFGIIVEEQFINKCVGSMTIYELWDWCENRHSTHRHSCVQCIFNIKDEPCPLVTIYSKATYPVVFDDSLEFSIKE